VRRFALLLEYEGTDFAGSQYQRNTGTIQEALERALSSLTSEPIRVAMAGRTDAGVHARGQVAAFSTASRHGPAVLVRAVNSHLPRSIAVRAAREVASTFDPRRQATGRWYRYTVHNSAQRPALLRRTVWQVSDPLDVEAMRRAASYLVGQHDVAAFTLPSVAARQGTVRRLTRVEASRSGSAVRLDVEGNAFLTRQVRRTTGALVEVGRGRLSVDGFAALVREAAPGSAGPTAPARGLCLMKVRYEDGLFDDETDDDIQP
jgi:tRNA pseudouridine38-40 synthase